MQISGTTGEDLARGTRRRKLIVWILVSLLVVGGPVLFVVQKPWRLKKLQQAAQEAMKRGDLMAASFNARRALQIDPDFVPACVTMAEIGEHNRVSDAVIWREKVLRLAGESGDTLLGLASSALRFGKVFTARAALDRVPPKDREREDFLVLSGAMALESKDYVEAVRLYEAAIQLHPGKAEYRFALGMAKCASDDSLTREEGRRLLLDLSSHETLGAAAVRAVIANCEAHQEKQAALRYAKQLQTMSTRKVSDDVLLLRLMRNTNDEKFPDELASAQQKALSDRKYAGALLLWMSGDGLAKDGLRWVQERNPKLGQSPELRPAIAGCYLTLMNWDALLAITGKGEWDAVEYVRHAYRSKAFREKPERSLASTEWDLAVNAANGQIEALSWLAQMAAEWKWLDENVQTLWAVLNKAPESRWAIEALQKSYLERNDTPGLRRVALHLVKIDPANDNAKNDFALASLLLNTETDRATKMARDLYTKHPENAAFNSTYAFAMHLTGRTAEGIEILEKLPPKTLEEPAIAAYYGVMLAANYAPEKASRYLEISRRANLLREEKDLVAQAEQSLARPNN